MHSFYRRRRFGLGFVTALTAIGLLGSCRPRGPEQRTEWITDRISDKLDLNEQQKVKFNELKNTILEARSRHTGEHRQASQEIKAMILSEKLESQKIQRLIEKRQQIMKQEFDPVFAKLSEFHESLTPEQKREAVKLLEKFESRWHHH
jgi:Spy/CpxP family protein refolding chaperone